jgi:addiction module RelB/DinJ family antitoxin
MVTIEIDVDESTLKEAEEVLYSIGMDVSVAVNVFLRRIAIEKGLPISMSASVSSSRGLDYLKEKPLPLTEEHSHKTRSNTTITRDMVDEVWDAFIRYNKGLGEIKSLSDEVSKNSGMNRGSAFIYLTILSNLIKGEPNTRTLKFQDLEYMIGRIKSELGENAYRNAIQSLKQSIPYWREKIPGLFADKVEGLCNKGIGHHPN